MPRSARQKSSTDVYHVMMRGINRQEIFEDDEDFLKFLAILKECKGISEFEIYAYCLMPNHVHLLIKTGTEPLEQVFRRIGTRFVCWYNKKYQRTGHLFQDRFRSETIENEARLLAVLRYIIQNPMKAGMESKPGSYPWSSYYSYTGTPDLLTDTDFISSQFPSREKMIEYLCQNNYDEEMDIGMRLSGVTDEQAGKIVQHVTGCASVSDFQRLEKRIQVEHARRLRACRLSLGQISRLTGLAKTTIYRKIEKDKGGTRNRPSVSVKRGTVPRSGNEKWMQETH